MFLMRCYATLGEFIGHITGTPVNLPIYTFGFFVALAFLAAAWILALELKRKEQQGLLHPVIREITRGEPPKPLEILQFALLGFIIGFKLIGIILNYQQFSDNPQQYILSGEGNWIGGIAGAILMAYNRYREKAKQQLEKPVREKVKVYPSQMVGDITIMAAIGGIIGAKIFHNLEYWQDFLADPVGQLLSFSGLTIYGGLLGGAATVIWYARRNNIGIIHLADAVAPALILAYGIGRIGCHMAGDGDWGIVNLNPKPAWLSFLPDWMWAYHYPYNVLNEGIPIPGCQGKFCYMLENPVFPTPFYETVMAFLIFGFLWLIRKRLHIAGMMTCIYLMLNGIERFLIEQIRVNAKYHILGMEVTQAEIIAPIFFLAGLTGLIYLVVKSKKQL